jgi:hypothetical protein
MISISAFSQEETPCNQLPIALPEVKAKAPNADAHFQENLPDSYSSSTFAHGVFKVLVNCDGTVKKVFYQDGSMEEADIAHFTEAIKEMDWTPAKEGGEDVRTNAFISLKINAGQATCAVH